MNQALLEAKAAFVENLNAHFGPGTKVNMDVFLADLFDHLGVTTRRELEELAYIIIDNHKPSFWPSVAAIKGYYKLAKKGRKGSLLVERDSPQWQAWRAYRVGQGVSVKLMDVQPSWTVPSEWPPVAAKGAA